MTFLLLLFEGRTYNSFFENKVFGNIINKNTGKIDTNRIEEAYKYYTFLMLSKVVL